MAQAAEKHDVQPRTLSLKGSRQTLEAFQPLIAFIRTHSRHHREHLCQQLLDAIAAHRVANRLDRLEPRKKKRWRMPYDRLMKPRAEAKLDILKGFLIDANRLSNFSQLLQRLGRVGICTDRSRREDRVQFALPTSVFDRFT